MREYEAQERLTMKGLRMALQKTAQNPPMIEGHKGARWFHATDQDVTGKSILKHGAILVPQPKGKGLMAPRVGFTYMSRSLETAAIYALGGVLMGINYEEKHWRGSRYGWIFEVDTSGPVDVEPDEDEVGELLSECLGNKCRLPWWFENMAQRVVSASRLRKVRDGEYAYFASVGKQLLSKMDNQEKLEIMAFSKNLAVRGDTEFIAAWRLDKARAPEIKKDGSNVLEIAEMVMVR